MVQSEEGMWIAYDDFIRSKASSDVMHDAKNATIQGLVEERDQLLEANDYLKAEVEELKRQPDALTVYLYAAELAKDDIKKLKAENAYLKSEVDRLKNTGAYLDKTLDDYIDKAMKRVNDERDEARISNALMHERLEAMKRLDAIRRMKDKADPLTDQQG